MKIHILPVKPEFQPDRQNFVSSPLQEYGVEQDFLWWLRDRPDLLADDGADWHYLPIFWNRYYVNRDWGQGGLDELQGEILRLISRRQPTFTICEYDILVMQPFLDLCGMVVFIASRQGERGIDIPLLCAPHAAEGDKDRPKAFLASFVGNLRTHSPRPEIEAALRHRRDCWIEHGNQGEKHFVEVMLNSHVALCPRGHGGSSFRFYEAMQLGVAPYHIGMPDTRPFKGVIHWDGCSFSAETVEGLNGHLDALARDKGILLEMGRAAAETYREHLAFGAWCRHVIRELNL